MSKKGGRGKGKIPEDWKLINGIYVHPNDTRKFPHPITEVHPKAYVYNKEGIKKRPGAPAWGFVEERDEGIEAIMMRFSQQSTDLIYATAGNPPPVQQFIDVVTKKKRQKIMESPISTVVDRYFVVKITMPEIE